MDYELLTEAARRLPHVSFVIAGHIIETCRDRVDTLRRLPNVTFTGETDDELGRAFIATFDIGLIPFRPGVMGDGINPVKMYMYLAAGKPVVSTWMQECRRHSPYATAARDVDAFVSAIEAELRTNTPEKAAARISFAKQNTWDNRAEQAARHLLDAGLCSPLQPRRVLAH